MRYIWVPWSATGTVGYGINIALGGADLLSYYASMSGREVAPGMTVLRLRGQVALLQASGALVNERASVAIGMVPKGGLETAPDLTSDNADVLWRWDGIIINPTYEYASGSFAQKADVIEINSKAKRKITRMSDELSFFVTNDGTQTLTVTTKGVALIGVH